LVVLVPVEVPPEPVPPLVPVPVPPEDVPPEEVPPVEPVVVGAAGVTAVVPPPLLAAPVPDDELELLEDDGAGVVDDGVLLDASPAEAVELLSPLDVSATPIDVLAGASSACGFFGTTSCVTLLPPQAESPPVARSIRATAVARRRMTG
jgi:hypothetical protein